MRPTNLYTFTGGNDGGGPDAALILSSNVLYGTTAYGGGANNGTVFAINLNGPGFTNLFSFTNGISGDDPAGSLILSGRTLFGTTSGGNGGFGTVFAINTDGTHFTNLYSFTANSGYPNYTNSDGSNPNAGLVLSGQTLYGTAPSGGRFGSGTLFAVNTNGTGFTNLYTFTATSGSPATNRDGANPRGSLLLSGGTLIGTAYNGGAFGSGTVFALNTNGTGFTILHTFTASSMAPYTNSDGAHPNAALILSGNTLYGTAYGGGDDPIKNLAYGTVFSLSLGAVTAPPLTITLSGTNVILSWSATGFTLQSTTNPISSANWVPVSGQNAVTNPLSGTQMFYRLSQ